MTSNKDHAEIIIGHMALIYYTNDTWNPDPIHDDARKKDRLYRIEPDSDRDGGRSVISARKDLVCKSPFSDKLTDNCVLIWSQVEI